MRLIDADALKKAIPETTSIVGVKYRYCSVYEKKEVDAFIDAAPTIDRPTRSQFKRMSAQLGYEKIVHCRECRKMKTYECPMHSANSYDDFCSFGERRKDGNEDRA